MSDRYLQAKSIAMEAMELPAEARQAWLEQRCAGDPGLRTEVDWLLDALRADMTEVLVPRWAAGDTPTEPLAQDTTIGAAQPGRYRILRMLGEGGMGRVYLAERGEGDLRQQVALKMLAGTGPQAGPTAAGMADECRILANLQHPNIAQFIDGGLSADGQPFLAMEYVEGDRIDHWCETRKLPLNARIRLFLKVCAAVEHAHQRLVIHRDLKPANILVRADGEPKLLDFGIARLTTGDAHAADPTATAHHALTLAYASPEHIEGRPLSTAADVWSLGVVLYELVAGVRPHHGVESGHLLPGAIVSGEIRPPSASACHAPSPDAGVSRIPADVDAIVMKALRRDPGDRYPSVAALADDLRRFLDSRPVSARRGQRLYRLRRFAWRHRWRVAAAAVVLLMLGGFAFERDRQLRQVTAERNKAQALSTFMADLFANADPSQAHGEDLTVRELLDRGAVDLRARQDVPAEVRAEMLDAIGQAYIGLQLGQQALPVLEEALQLRRTSAAAKQDLAATLGLLADAHLFLGQNREAIALNREARTLLPQDDPAQFEAWARHRVQELRNEDLLGEVPAARIIEVLRELDGRLQPLATSQSIGRVRITALEALASALNRAERVDEALAVQREVVALMEVHYASQPATRLLARSNLGAMLLGGNGVAEGVALLEEVDRDYVHLVGEATVQRAVVLNQLGIGYQLLGDKARQLETLLLATQVAREAGGPENRFYLQIAVTAAQALTGAGRHEESVQVLREVLPALEARAAPGIDAVNYAYALGALGFALLESGGDPREATEVLARAEQAVLPHARDFMVVYDSAMRGQARAMRASGDTPGMRKVLERYQALLEAEGIPDDSPWRRSLARMQDQAAAG
ncbi:serine/threonine protein kinase [Pseudoxanthomonas suwonensis]|uniref:serine/threonine protein kinase n=1 Tax=Pseudoxanthomonas suwonensis TaxID=314722 RepID=UPI0004BB94CC|nr:serine/threonine-protein kinase [Pseudoxanthomonas suwonensis]